MDLARFIDTYRDAIARRVVESYPPRYRPSTNGRPLPQLLRSPLGAQADAIRGAALSLEAQRGRTVVGEMGTGKTFIAASGAHGRLRARARALPASPHAQVEARGRGDGARRPRRDRRLDHRPRTPAALRRRRAALRDHVARARQALLPLAARHGGALGDHRPRSRARRGDRGAVPGLLLPGLPRAGRGQGRRAPARARPRPPQAALR